MVRRFTLDDKIKFIEELNTGFTHAQVCKKYELSASALSTFKCQLDVINATQSKDYKSSETKICSRCNKELDISMFGKDKSKKDGLSIKCKICKKYTDKKYRIKKRKNNIMKILIKL